MRYRDRPERASRPTPAATAAAAAATSQRRQVSRSRKRTATNIDDYYATSGSADRRSGGDHRRRVSQGTPFWLAWRCGWGCRNWPRCHTFRPAFVLWSFCSRFTPPPSRFVAWRFACRCQALDGDPPRCSGPVGQMPVGVAGGGIGAVVGPHQVRLTEVAQWLDEGSLWTMRVLVRAHE